MDSYQKVVDFLNAVEFFPPDFKIESWEKKGISHGFVGINGSLSGHHSLNQVHGTQLWEASSRTREDNQSKPEGDGIYTSEPNEKVSVKTADCLPILFHTSKKVMAVHGGWKGLFSGIIAKSVELMEPTPDLLVGIGPHISCHSFEVGPEFMERLESSFLSPSMISWLVQKGVGDRWHIDLGLFAAFHLATLGVKGHQISIMKSCTVLDAARWHSYRRSGNGAGRNWSWIGLNSE